MNTPTIAAAATGSGRSAIGIVRLSGPAAISAASAIFTPAAGGSLADAPDRTLVYGVLRDQEGQVIDRPLATVSRAPHSYTGEDTAELQCHGSPAVLTMALEALYAQGVQPAPPGEFTKRAFLNGRMDLAQAEAVADLIDAETEACVHHAAGQLGGALSRRVEAIYSRLVDLMAHFHAVLDYPDEDIDPFGAHDIRQALADAGQQLDGLLATYQRGRLLSQGVPCAIVGKPNAGKSSLLNALLGYDRALVTPIAGTTRDTIEERIQLGGVLLRLFDNAALPTPIRPGMNWSRRSWSWWCWTAPAPWMRRIRPPFGWPSPRPTVFWSIIRSIFLTAPRRRCPGWTPCRRWWRSPP